MKLTSLLQVVGKLQRTAKIDNLQQVKSVAFFAVYKYGSSYFIIDERLSLFCFFRFPMCHTFLDSKLRPSFTASKGRFVNRLRGAGRKLSKSKSHGTLRAKNRNY